ncbi:hypothetical protein [Nocardia huaxiensis]|uniref:Serine protease n=1 Tax=Nocardia huaxiensis TaxID=2755382 RepID=A0A7D6ZLE6_9NOCA|nr:hypothetical protein [Nocardia huaxiensis]QLY30243.1 hypothetical protein H0264_34685 [Nocardia huaxiensis]UFS96137.1 hypothetical protein LPY97_36760 [Nocardia huaxiensis]
MRVRTIVAVSAFAGLSAAGVLAAGSASAATPIAIPEVGAVGVALSPGETQALANGPVPALVEKYAPRDALSVSLAPDSALPEEDSRIYADMPEIIREAASHPNGSIAVVAVPDGVVIVQDF